MKTNVRESKCEAPPPPSNAVETQIETDKASLERNPPTSDVTQHIYQTSCHSPFHRRPSLLITKLVPIISFVDVNIRRAGIVKNFI